MTGYKCASRILREIGIINSLMIKSDEKKVKCPILDVEKSVKITMTNIAILQLSIAGDSYKSTKT